MVLRVRFILPPDNSPHAQEIPRATPVTFP